MGKCVCYERKQKMMNGRQAEKSLHSLKEICYQHERPQSTKRKEEERTNERKGRELKKTRYFPSFLLLIRLPRHGRSHFMSAQSTAAREAAAEGLETQREEITTAEGEEHIITLYTSFHSDYCNYTWESARVLAWHLAVSELNVLKGKRVLEMGCGTALPGILAARCGASVTLTDAHTAQGALDRARYLSQGIRCGYSLVRDSAFSSQEIRGRI